MRIAFLFAALLAACSSSRPALRHAKTSAVGPKEPGVTPTERPAATIQADGTDLSWLRPIYFDYDSSDLLPDARDTLALLGDWLAANPSAALRIEGHCDERGTTEYNIGLGQRRAQVITDYLVRLGTPSTRLTPVSYGAERPVVEGHDELAWAKNRRGELDLGR